MGMIMIKCPQTGHAVSTGLQADADAFRCSAVFFSRTSCSVCEMQHEWFSMQAWVEDRRISVRRQQYHAKLN